MTTLNIQWADADETAIISYFGGPQLPEVFANLGTVDASDARWAAYYDSMPAVVQAMLPAPELAAGK